MITYIKGDVLKSGCTFVAHGVNCQGGFGSGVAGQIKATYPNVAQAYLRKFNRNGWKLGEIQVVPTPKGPTIINCATQDSYGMSDAVHADYKAIRTVMTKLYRLIKGTDSTLAMPKIGAGLAGGNWKTIEKIINDCFPDITVYVYLN